MPYNYAAVNNGRNSVELFGNWNIIDRNGIIKTSHGVAQTSLTKGASSVHADASTRNISVALGGLEPPRLKTARLLIGYVCQFHHSATNNKGVVR